MSETELMTMRQAAVFVGWGPGDGSKRKMRRVIEAKERSLGSAIATRTGATKGGHLQVTAAALRAYMPELFSRHDPVLQAVRENSEMLLEAIEALRARVAEVERVQKTNNK
jgi:hypothetical protein